MANLISSWSNKVEALPQSYVLPIHERPSDSVRIVKEIPVIDLGQAYGEERVVVAQQLLKAWEEYGFFQVINHGISENLMEEAMKVYEEFFSLPVEEKADYAKVAENAGCKAMLYSNLAQYYGTKEYSYWRDALNHNCDDPEILPHNPPRFREVIGSYSGEVRKLSKFILGLVSEGLGLEEGYFDKELGRRMVINHYPPCPDPGSTLGLGGHCDADIITLTQQKVYGLQILTYDEKWIGVEPLPNAFVVNCGLALTVISNGKLASRVHRVVTNKTQARTSISTFILPKDVVEPGKSSLDDGPPIFKSFNWYTEFMPHYFGFQSDNTAALEAFKIKA
ncbi:hypothetical protein RND71_038244 [Anisodus tanguticus]|uniref:Fe2OG dioxygenase domain-containing protein n=1 Tax=Anisodus tanguticus TaxID=243964 RepID=A0AAE1URY8_9SOLA|nr:hypothetical protein RND71_038244 [Anisodus tanguticus]